VDLEDVVADGLGQGTSLADHDLIAGAGIEAWGAVSGDHLPGMVE